MIYTDLAFLMIFLPIVLVMYDTIGRWRQEICNIILLAAGIVYMGYSHGICGALVLPASCLILAICEKICLGEKTPDGVKKLGGLALAVGYLWGGAVLCFGFLPEIADVAGSVGQQGLAEAANRVVKLMGLRHKAFWLPVPFTVLAMLTIGGLFEISHLWRNDSHMQEHRARMGRMICFFPRLLGGPFTWADSGRQGEPVVQVTLKGFGEGIYRIAAGIAKKILLADAFGVMGDVIFRMTMTGEALLKVPALLAVLGAAAVLLQIYYSWSALYDMAIGMGLLFGIRLTAGMDHPFRAVGLHGFVTRLFLPLSQWMKTYIYSTFVDEKNFHFKKYLRASAVCCLLSCLFFGMRIGLLLLAVFLFVCFALEKLFGWEQLAIPVWIKKVILIIQLLFAAVFFRCENYYQIKQYVGNMIMQHANGFYSPSVIMMLREYALVWIAGILLLLPWNEICTWLSTGIKSRAGEERSRMVCTAARIFSCLTAIVLSLFGCACILFTDTSVSGHLPQAAKDEAKRMIDRVTDPAPVHDTLHAMYKTVENLPGSYTSEKLTRARDKEGYEFSIDFWQDVTDDSRQIAVYSRRLQDRQSEAGNGFAFILLPEKVVRPEMAAYGIPYSDGSSKGELVTRWMRHYQVNYLDLREEEEIEKLTYEELWYKKGDGCKAKAQMIASDILLNRMQDADQKMQGSLLLIHDGESEIMEEALKEQYEQITVLDIFHMDEEEAYAEIWDSSYDQIVMIISPHYLDPTCFTEGD